MHPAAASSTTVCALSAGTTAPPVGRRSPRRAECTPGVGPGRRAGEQVDEGGLPRRPATGARDVRGLQDMHDHVVFLRPCGEQAQEASRHATGDHHRADEHRRRRGRAGLGGTRDSAYTEMRDCVLPKRATRVPTLGTDVRESCVLARREFCVPCTRVCVLVRSRRSGTPICAPGGSGGAALPSPPGSATGPNRRPTGATSTATTPPPPPTADDAGAQRQPSRGGDGQRGQQHQPRDGRMRDRDRDK